MSENSVLPVIRGIFRGIAVPGVIYGGLMLWAGFPIGLAIAGAALLLIAVTFVHTIRPGGERQRTMSFKEDVFGRQRPIRLSQPVLARLITLSKNEPAPDRCPVCGQAGLANEGLEPMGRKGSVRRWRCTSCKTILRQYQAGMG